MKRIFLSLIISMALPLFGNPVDENTAKQLAQNFWKENNIMGVRGDIVFKKRMDDARFVNVAPQIGYSEFYIFNNEDGEGFVIIAADDRVAPILAYSYDNNFVIENMPLNLKGWLDGYAKQIQFAKDSRAQSSEENRIEWECLRQGKTLPTRSETAVNPLITTTWDQDYPYNHYCPYNSFYSQYTYTGCVATAMAQIMKYHEYPAHGYGYHEYYCFPYGTQSASFGNTVYDWSNMIDDYSGYYNNTQRNAVATLMYTCGVSVNMDYGVNGSSAYVINYDDYEGYHEYCAENALKTYFGYSANEIQGLQRSHYESTWISKLKNELNHNRPILYRGGGANGGHAFVCDGYDNYNYFHFNWGWSGNNNAYFSIDNLNTNNGNFSYDQQAIIGIQPDNELQSFDLVLCHDVEMLGDWGTGNFDFGQDISMYTEILNQGNSPFTGYVAAAVFDDDGYFIDFLGGGNTTIQPYYYVYETTTHEGGIPFLPSYEYLYHTIMFYSTNGENWTIINEGNYSNDGIFQVFNNGEDIVTNSEFTFSNGEDNVIYNNQEVTINVDVINEGTETYYGSIWLCLTNYNTNTSQVVDIFYVDEGLPSNYHYLNGINFTNTISLPVGEYYLELMYVKDDHLYYAGSVFYPCIKRVYVLNAPYTINVSANPSNGGTVSGGGDYLEGVTCSLTATANNNYIFANWTENGNVVSNYPNYSFPVTCNRNLIANFQYQPPQQCSISVSAYPTEGGTVSGGGTYQQGQTCTISATNSTGFSFLQWNDGVTSNPRTVTVSQDSTFVAFFRDNNNQGNGGFSVSSSNKVIISQGNLQYQASTSTWRFAENQYDFVGATNSNIGPNYDGWIDLFGWGTSGWNCGNTYYHPYDKETGNNAYYYYGPLGSYDLTGNYANSDWGVYNAISNGGNEAGMWKTLSSTEFNYLINSRANATAKRSRATVNGVHGLIILPDSWTLPSGISFVSNSSDWDTNDYTVTQWQQLENNGAVFLPAAGYRDYITVYGANSNGVYWSSSCWNGYGAMALRCNLSTLDANYYNYMRCAGASIRLVRDYEEFTILGQPSPLEGGNITGSGIYGSGETCILSATPNENYTFVNWTENGVQVSANTSYSFTVTNNRTIKANFLYTPTNYYSVNVSANPSIGGSVNGGGTYVHGQACTVTAMTNTGYYFVNWTEGGTQVSTNASYTFNVTSNRNLVANFQAQQQQYVVSVSANPINSGHVSGGGSFNPGASCTVQATANSGYVFVNWTENGTQVSTNANYTFTVTGNRNLVANFDEQLPEYSVTVMSNPSNGGTVTGGGIYTQGQSCTVSATANDGYTFVNWTENGTQVSSNANYTFVVISNMALVANFQIQSYTISVAANPSNGGTVTGGGSYEYGQTCSVTANAGNGYNFVNWTENGVQVSANTSYSFTVTGNRNLVANFTSQNYVITATADPSAGGVITGSGGYNYGETCTLTTTPNTGYTFVNWTKNGTQVSTNSTYSFTVTESATYVAHFNLQSYSITVAAYPNNAGSVTGGGSYNYGQTCTVHATANSGYTFTNWTENGSQVSANANYSFTVTGSRNLVANFTQNTYTIQASAGMNGTITPSGAVTVIHGANQTFSMIPDEDYEVQEVYIDGNPVGAMTSYTFTNVTANHFIHVSFAHIEAVGENHGNRINVYPNPTNDIVIIEGEGMNHIRVMNVLGQVVYDTNVVDEQVSLNLSSMAKGIYMLQIKSLGRHNYKKIVVR